MAAPSQQDKKHVHITCLWHDCYCEGGGDSDGITGKKAAKPARDCFNTCKCETKSSSSVWGDKNWTEAK